MFIIIVYNINVYLLLDLNVEFLVFEWVFNLVLIGCSICYINLIDLDDGIYLLDVEIEYF